MPSKFHCKNHTPRQESSKQSQHQVPQLQLQCLCSKSSRCDHSRLSPQLQPQKHTSPGNRPNRPCLPNCLHSPPPRCAAHPHYKLCQKPLALACQDHANCRSCCCSHEPSFRCTFPAQQSPR